MGKKQPGIRRDDEGPALGSVLDVKRVSGKDRFIAAIASPKVNGFWSHWNGDFTVSCLDDPTVCPGCLSFQPQRWHGFIHVCDPKGSRGVWLDLTKPGKVNLENAIPDEQPLRGCVFWVWRESQSDKRPLCFEFIKRVEPTVLLPDEADPDALTKRIWGHTKKTRREQGVPV